MNDAERTEFENFVDNNFVWFRKRIGTLEQHGLSMEDFSFLENMVSEGEDSDIYNAIKLGFSEADKMEISNMDEAKNFVKGFIVGYAFGLKATNLPPDVETEKA